jgi:hypothetical protein
VSDLNPPSTCAPRLPAPRRPHTCAHTRTHELLALHARTHRVCVLYLASASRRERLCVTVRAVGLLTVSDVLRYDPLMPHADANKVRCLRAVASLWTVMCSHSIGPDRSAHCVRCSCDSAIHVALYSLRSHSEWSRPFPPQGVVAFGRMLHELATGAELDGPNLALDANLRCAPQIASIIKLIFKVAVDLLCPTHARIHARTRIFTHAFTHAHAYSLMHSRTHMHARTHARMHSYTRTHALIHTRALRNTHAHARKRRFCTNASRVCAAGFGLCQSSLFLAAYRLFFRIRERLHTVI